MSDIVIDPPKRKSSGISNHDIHLTMEQVSGDRVVAARMLSMTRDKLTRRLNADPKLHARWVKKQEPATPSGNTEPVSTADELLNEDAIDADNPPPERVSPKMIDAILQNAGLTSEEAKLTQHLHQMHAQGYSIEMLKVLEGAAQVLPIKLLTHIGDVQKRIQSQTWLHVPGEGKSTLDEEKMLYDTLVNLTGEARKLFDSVSAHSLKMLELKMKADGAKNPGRKTKPGFTPLESRNE
jgi:hypothetical protein